MKRFLLLVVLLVVSACANAAVVICQLVPGADPQLVGATYKIPLLDQAYKAPFFLYEVTNEEQGDAVEAAMRTDPRVVWAEDDGDVTSPEKEGLRASLSKGSILPAVGERKFVYDANPGLFTQIGWDQALAAQSTRTVKVAILDTGLSPRVKYLWTKTLGGMNFVEEGTRPYDLPIGDDTNGNGIFDEGAGHGTMVTGLIDQTAPNARFVICRVADSDGVASVWTLIKGLTYAVATKCEVANVSLGTLENLPALSDVMDWCERKRLLVVAAIGNDGLHDSCEPAGLSKVVSVAGLDANNRKAAFSNYKSSCDFSAPATGISSAWWDNKLATWSGTSFASPLVSGVIANCLSRTTPLAPWEIRGRLKGAGYNVDALNSRYTGNLGTGLDLKRFDARFKTSG